MPELEKKYVDGSEYYGNTTYLWQNMRVLGIIVGCKSTSQSRGERFLTEDLFFLVRILRASFVRAYRSYRSVVLLLLLRY